MSLSNLLGPKTKAAVSASAPGSSKKAILSDSEDQWTGPSLPAFVHLKFAHAPIHGPEEIAITFQGGFVGTKTEVWAAGESESSPLHLVGNIYPEDKSRRQVFPLRFQDESITELKLVFEESSDNQGRVTVYQVEVLGKEVREARKPSISRCDCPKFTVRAGEHGLHIRLESEGEASRSFDAY